MELFNANPVYCTGNDIVDFKAWVSKLSMAKVHSHYCRLVYGPPAEKLTIIVIPNKLKFCVIFIVYTPFTNVSVGRLIQSGGPRVGDPNFKGIRYEDVEWI
jgi:hypothetical protein